MDIKGLSHQNPLNKGKWGRFYMDKSEDSLVAIKLLRDNGYRVITFPVNGTMGPELNLNRQVYLGLNEIKELVKR